MKLQPPRPALLLGVCAASVGLAACGELEPPAVTIGESVLTVSDLRVLWADISTSQRPPLSTRAERRAFVDRIVERRLLAEEGERLLAEFPDRNAIDFETIETTVLSRRLGALVGGEAVIDSAAITQVARRMTTAHQVEWVSFTSEGAAQEAARRIAEGVSFEDLRNDPNVGGSAGERRILWSPYPDPIADAVADLEPAGHAGPILAGGEWLVVRLNRREKWDPGEGAASRTSIARGLRVRHRRARTEELRRELWLSEGLEIEEDGIARLAARTIEAILSPGATENDPDWAIPVLGPGEESLPIATARGEVVYTAADYLAALRRHGAGPRPRGGNLVQEVRRLVQDELGGQLLRDEAIRRGLRREWFTERMLRAERENRLIRLAVQAIEAGAEARTADVDTVLATLRETRPEIFHRPARARVLRLDLPTRPAALRELANLRRARSGQGRLQEILEGQGAPLAGTYHLTYLSPGTLGAPEVDNAVFDSGPGSVAGPFELGNVWIVVSCLEVQPAYDLDDETARRELIGSLGVDRGELPRWVQSRRLEARVAVDEETLDALAAAG